MTRRTRMKVCGLTRAADAALAVELGADALGFVFWSTSPRAVSREAARAVHATLPPFVARVGVFVDASPDDVASTVREVGLDVVQLHGDEPAEAFARVGARIVKVATLEGDDDVRRVVGWPGWVMPLVDAVDRDRRGGTGRLADWARAAQVAAARPTLLAGGLTAANVGEAIRRVRPWGVDVSSGVEEAPGVKSPERLRAFALAVGETTGEGQ